MSIDCSVVDTDNDGTPNYLDLDSDGDGCFDALEAGYIDADNDGQLDGTGYDTNGLITGGDGYEPPIDTDPFRFGTADYLEDTVSVALAAPATTAPIPMVTVSVMLAIRMMIMMA